MKFSHCAGTFLADFIADIGSYSQLKIVSFFPIHRKKIPIESYKIKKLKKILKMFETWTTSLIQSLND